MPVGGSRYIYFVECPSHLAPWAGLAGRPWFVRVAAPFISPCRYTYHAGLSHAGGARTSIPVLGQSRPLDVSSSPIHSGRRSSNVVGVERARWHFRDIRVVNREMAAAAVGSAAVAASDKFGPYLEGTAPRLAAMVELGEERAWELRGRSLEALGHVALAVGNAKFAPYRDTALRAAAANLELDSTELAEYSYGFFANCAKVMRSDFGPLLPQLVPHLLDVARDGEPGLRESVLQQLASLASTARYHLRDYVPRILDLVVEYWAQHLEQVVPLLEQVASANAQEPMRPFATRALPLLLASLAPPSSDVSEDEVPPAARDEARLALVLRATMLLRERPDREPQRPSAFALTLLFILLIRIVLVGVNAPATVSEEPSRAPSGDEPTPEGAAESAAHSASSRRFWPPRCVTQPPPRRVISAPSLAIFQGLAVCPDLKPDPDSLPSRARRSFTTSASSTMRSTTRSAPAACLTSPSPTISSRPCSVRVAGPPRSQPTRCLSLDGPFSPVCGTGKKSEQPI